MAELIIRDLSQKTWWPNILYPFLCWWTFRLLPCLAIENTVAINIGMHVSFGIMFFSRYMLKSGIAAAAAAKSLQSCLTLCDPIDGSPPGSPVPGILQARILEWVAFSSSNVWKWKVKVKSLSRVWLVATPWTAAHQTSPSMRFSRQEWGAIPSSITCMCSF